MTPAPDIDALVKKCRKPGCGAQERIGNPCTDWDCPQQTVPAEVYRAALTALQADLKAARAENKALSDEIDALEDEGCGVDDDIRKMTDRAEKAEDALTAVCIERDRLRENVKQQVHRKGVAGSYRDEFKSKAEAAEASLAEARTENEKLRSIISDSAKAIGNGAYISPECTVEFMGYLPEEIRRALTTHRGSE